jgi:hypothetical protein
LFPQNIRIHASTAYQPQTSGIAYSRRKLPSAAPDHTGLNNGVLNIEKLGNAVLHKLGAWVVSKI